MSSASEDHDAAHAELMAVRERVVAHDSDGSTRLLAVDRQLERLGRAAG